MGGARRSRWRERARRAYRRLRPGRLPWPVWVALGLVALGALDVAWQVARKPTELLGAIAPSSPKSPQATWAAYGPIFDAHSTGIVDPALLAALAQVESSGDPLARTYWTFRWRWNPLELYRPASSAVGLLQITDATYADARRLCIHDHAVARQGPWHDPAGCWLNGLYLRTVPSHAVEMTAAYLHEAVERILAEHQLRRATPEQQRQLAAVVHLCGRERGAAHARRAFRVARGERCGDHDLAAYLARVGQLRRAFERFGAGPDRRGRRPRPPARYRPGRSRRLRGAPPWPGPAHLAQGGTSG